MTTSVANPHYLPAVYIQVNIINFTVTFDGLQEQLLSAVVRQVGNGWPPDSGIPIHVQGIVISLYFYPVLSW